MQFQSAVLAFVLSLCVPTSKSVRIKADNAVGNASLISATNQRPTLTYPAFVSGNCPFAAKRSCPVSLSAGRGAPSPITFTACAQNCDNVPEIDNNDVHAWTNGLWAKLLGFKKNFHAPPSEAISDFAKLEHLVDGMQAEEMDTFDLMKRWVNSVGKHVDGSLKAIVKDTGHSVSNLLERAAWTPYANKLWKGKKVVIVGGGPIGLRMAVEAALLGADVTLGDARDGWTRANVMKMWPVAKHDLESIGLKEFSLLSGDFPITNIAIMQHAMLRVALILGASVEIMKFKELRKIGENYGAVFEKDGKELPPIGFDAIFDASGVRGALAGQEVDGRSLFNRDSDSSGSKRVAVTANFQRFKADQDKHWAFGETSLTSVGAKYNDDKQRFKITPQVELKDLVWFQSVLSNYVVMALDLEELQAKYPGAIKDRGVSRSDLLRRENIDFDELLKMAVSIAEDWKIPFENDADGQPKMLEGINKLAIFDFMGGTMSKDPETMKASMVQPLPGGRQYVLAIGDALRAPFWPEGTGMSRGILSVLHAGFALTKVWGASDASGVSTALEEAKSWAFLAAFADGSGCKGKCGAAAVNQYVHRGYRGMEPPPGSFSHWM